MTLVKSLLLGGAAGLVAVSAQAADLPSKKAAPVEYVKVCSAQGAGFFYIPGTDTCIKIGGQIRAQTAYSEPLHAKAEGGDGRAVDATSMYARGRLNLDARTATEYGLLRTFVRLDMSVTNGGAASPSLDKGFIQFGGLTAGRVQSFFDFYADDYNYGLALGSDQSTEVLAYTASFGSGFSATIALEDAGVRRTASDAAFGGTRAPDVVAALRVDQGWGSAQLSGAVHQLNTPNPTAGNGDSEYGFAVQGGVKLKADALAAGDALYLQAAYADGAVSYLGLPSKTLGTVTGYKTQYDFAYNALGGVETTKGWSVVGAFLHYWTPSVRQAVFAGYNDINVYSDVDGKAYGPTAFAARDVKVLQVGTNVVWSPVKDFNIGAEVAYISVDPAGSVNGKGSENQFQTRLRIQRDF